MVRQRKFPGVAVLGYHAIRNDGLPDGSMAFEGLHVRAGRFEQHIRALVSGCTPISLDDWRRHLDNGKALPDRPVHITFDDGYRSVLHEALPVLERYGVPATVFLATSATERGERYWYDALALEAGPTAVAELKEKSHEQWKMRVAQVDRAPQGERDPHMPLSAEDVARLAASPLIEIGGHTHTHPILSHADRETQRLEIAQCAAAIQEWTGRPMRAFAYPNGRAHVDFTAETSELLGAAGVDHAFTTEPGFAAVDGDPLTHPRFVMTSDVLTAHLLHRLARAWQ
jgi:peptidoglycan/xylan/chitin deacetylase (PgdA/CDA1 family)